MELVKNIKRGNRSLTKLPSVSEPSGKPNQTGKPPNSPSQEEIDYPRCLRCGRKLVSPEARARGYGDICYQKIISHGHIAKLF